jgi:hypothetical protein
MKHILTLVAVALSMASCTLLAPRKSNETMSRGAYATADAMDKGRFDLADRYAHALTKLLPPPKKRIDIQPIDK